MDRAKDKVEKTLNKGHGVLDNAEAKPECQDVLDQTTHLIFLTLPSSLSCPVTAPAPNMFWLSALWHNRSLSILQRAATIYLLSASLLIVLLESANLPDGHA